MMDFFCRAEAPHRTLGERLYQACVAVREKGEQIKFDPLIAFGKMATATVSRFVRVGGREVK